MRCIRWVAVGGFVLVEVVLAASLAFRNPRTRDYSTVPLDRSDFLRDVHEPITMVSGLSWDDNSQGLVFKDSKRVERSVCLLFLEDEDDPRKRNLLLGSDCPNPSYGKRVPVSGTDEQAFLGLLERWFRSDPETQAIRQRIAEKSTEPFSDEGKTEEYFGKVIAVRILIVLRRRKNY